MSNDTKLRTVINAILTVPARRLYALTEMAKNLSGPDGEAWHVALKAQLKAGTAKVVQVHLPLKANALGRQQAVWQGIYDKYFSILQFTVPTFGCVEGRWVIPVAQGMTCDIVYAAYKFPKWKWCDSIDAQLDRTREMRSPTKGSYLLSVRDIIEPDSQYLGKSVNQVDSDGKIGVTLLERMLLELYYYETTGNHLDKIGASFCSGSRYLDGDVPGVCLSSDDKVYVGRFHPGNVSDGYGVRSAVTL